MRVRGACASWVCAGCALAAAPALAARGCALCHARRDRRGRVFLGATGIILGRRGGGYLMLAGQQGVALAAPPRAGKGTGVVVPNALNWPGSLVCVDIKRENWTITAGFRARSGQACYLFDPFAEDGRTARWNPFSYVSADPARRLNDLQRIAEMLYPGSAQRGSLLDRLRPLAVLRDRALSLRDALAPGDHRRGAAPGHGE